MIAIIIIIMISCIAFLYYYCKTVYITPVRLPKDVLLCIFRQLAYENEPGLARSICKQFKNDPVIDKEYRSAVAHYKSIYVMNRFDALNIMNTRNRILFEEYDIKYANNGLIKLIEKDSPNIYLSFYDNKTDIRKLQTGWSATKGLYSVLNFTETTIVVKRI